MKFTDHRDWVFEGFYRRALREGGGGGGGVVAKNALLDACVSWSVRFPLRSCPRCGFQERNTEIRKNLTFLLASLASDKDEVAHRPKDISSF